MNKYYQQGKEARLKFLKWKGCDRKLAFDNESDAQNPGQDVYKCTYCEKYHRTSAKRKWMAGVHTLSKRLHKK